MSSIVMHSLSRRKALFSAVAILLPGTLSSVSAWATSPDLADPEQTSLPEQLLALFHSPESMCAVGRAYLAGVGGDSRSANENALFVRELEEQLRHPASRLRPWLRQRVSRDFEEGRVVCLDGWVLSVTEVELCALFAIAR